MFRKPGRNGRAWLFVAGMVCSMTAAQLAYKFAGLYSLTHAGLVRAWLLNPALWGALVATAVGTAFWLLALRSLPLSVAYPWTAIIYALTPLGSAYLFQDLLSLRYLVGMVFIVAGVAITTSASRGADDGI